MMDMENKDLEQENEQPAEGSQEPVDDGFSQPPEDIPQEMEPALAEPQVPAEDIPSPEPPPEAPEAPPQPPQEGPVWQDVSSTTPPQPEQAPPPPPQGPPAPGPAQAPWQAQPHWTAAPGQPAPEPQAAPYGQGYYGGYPAYYGYPPQQAAQPAPQPGQVPPAAPYGQGYYGGSPAYYGYPPQQAAQPGQPGQMPPTGYYDPSAAYAPYAAYPQTGAQPPAKEKKKKPLALKLLLWIVSILAAGSLIGFGVYVALEWEPDTPHYPSLPGLEEEVPDISRPESKPKDDAPESSAPQEEEPGDLPNVDVTPNTDGIQLQPRPQGEPLEANEVYEQAVKSTVAITVSLTRDGQTAQSRGSGIIATSDGYMITNAHVVLNSKSARVKVTTYDGQEYDAVVVGVDRTTDLAVIKTNDHGFTPANFGDAGALSMGEWVLALGNPGGTKYANSLTRGIVSGLNREAGQYSAGGMTYIQTDAAINPGNSGGPLVNMYGQVVGINSSKIVTENYEGMGFAIPVSQAQPIINELLSGGYIKGRTRLGIMIQEIDAATAMMAQVPQGLRITRINEDSAFTGTEAQVDDIITAIDGETVTSLRDVSNLLASHAPGDQISVTLVRLNDDGGTSELTVTVTLLEDKGETQE